MHAVLDQLRERIQEIEGRPPVSRQVVSSGMDDLDAAVGGLPCPGLVEVSGRPGSGRVRVALAWALPNLRPALQCRSGIARRSLASGGNNEHLQVCRGNSTTREAKS